MDIQHIGTNKFIVGLSRTDMEQFDITYDEMDYSNVETKRVIWTILDAVRRKTGKDVDPSGNLMIEAAPDNSGGCLLMFTVPASRKNTGTVVSKNNGTQIFEFENTDTFLDALSAMKCKPCDGRFFTDGRKFRIEFSNEKSNAFQNVLREYSRFVGKDTITIVTTHEHWNEISLSS